MNSWQGFVFTAKSFFGPSWKQKRIRFFLFFALLPLVITLLIYLLGLGTSLRGDWRGEIYLSNFLAYYLQFLAPLLALFTGISLVGDEIDDRTIHYLTGSAFPRYSVLLGKFTAVLLVSVLLIIAGFLPAMISTGILLARPGLAAEALLAAGVLVLSLLAYCSVFTFLGVFMKRAVLFGLIFVFGWENLVQYLPGLPQKLTLNHYLKSLLPGLQQSKGPFAFLIQPTPVWPALFVLLGVVLVFLSAAALVFSRREYGGSAGAD